MKVLIPLAGFGTRLRPHTYSRPKPLVNVAGKPVLGHLLDKFKGLPVEEFIFITGWLGDQIEDYVRENYPDTPSHFYQQTELSGQSTAIYLAKEVIEGPLFILFVDTIFEADLSFLTTTAADGVAFVKEVDDPRRFGVAVTNDAGNVTGFIEKPESVDNKLAVIGMYYMKDGKALVDAIETQIRNNRQTKGEFYLVDALSIMLERSLRFIVSEVDVWLDAGTVEAVLETNGLLLERSEDNSAKVRATNSVVIPPVNVHPTAQIVNAVIGPHVTIGAGCQIKNSIIRDSIIDQESVVRDALLDHSLIGQKTQVTGHFQSLNIGDTSSAS